MVNFVGSVTSTCNDWLQWFFSTSQPTAFGRGDGWTNQQFLRILFLLFTLSCAPQINHLSAKVTRAALLGQDGFLLFRNTQILQFLKLLNFTFQMLHYQTRLFDRREWESVYLFICLFVLCLAAGPTCLDEVML